MAIDLKIIGDSGLTKFGGRIYEEQLRKLQGSRAWKIYAEMRDNDAVVGAILFCIEMLCRQVKWDIETSDDKDSTESAQFITECMEDMSHTWQDLISEILSMLVFGWAYFEIIYKVRGGNSKDATQNSRYQDGKYGWRKIALRAQETLYQWDFDDDGGIKGMWQTPQSGRPVFIPIEKALLFRTKSDKNNPEGRSILRNMFTSYYKKTRIEDYEAIGIERDLAGLPVMEVPPELLSTEASSGELALLDDLKRLVSEIRRDEREGMIIPSERDTEDKPTGFKFRLEHGGGARQFDTNTIITRYEQRMAMSVLAEFILLGLDKVGSFSLASSKTNLFSTALSAWLDSIEAVFNRFAIPRLFKVNGWKLENLPRLKHGAVQDISLGELGDFLDKIAKAGIPLVGDAEVENALRAKVNLPLKTDEKL